MSKKKSGKHAQEASIVRSSAAEYLTFVAASGTAGVQAVYADENVWLTQKMMGVLHDVETHTINDHLKKVFADSEIEERAVIRNFRRAAANGISAQLSDLMAPLDLGWKERSRAELALMADLHTLLTNARRGSRHLRTQRL